ncbi:MAG: hypothetical protein A2Y10_00110 [Planctomycetes bacterium GWF2_41_51]|nr:MAG: hypothetical protein A2Y10_00110 [Planctomycetes bacterium GWF2_41_51]HBG27083.1 hypothetical protein [Phycisphaerales bacterium]
MRKILYLGDTALAEAASYLAGVMNYFETDFDYAESKKKFDESLLKNDYDAIIISDYPAENFTESQIDKIIKKVKSGTGLLMIGGWESFTGLNGGYNHTALTEVLPIIMEDFDDRANCSGPCLIVRNREHIITDSLPFENQAPAVGGFNKLRLKRFCNEILSVRRFKAEYKDGKFEFLEAGDFPLLVTGSYGKGNVAAFASDAAPHWVGPLVDWGDKRITAKAAGGTEIEVGNWYAELFINMIRWVSKTERQQNTEAKC